MVLIATIGMVIGLNQPRSMYCLTEANTIRDISDEQCKHHVPSHGEA